MKRAIIKREALARFRRENLPDFDFLITNQIAITKVRKNEVALASAARPQNRPAMNAPP